MDPDPELKIVINWCFLKTAKHLDASESVTSRNFLSLIRRIIASRPLSLLLKIAHGWPFTKTFSYSYCLFQQLPLRANDARKDLMSCLLFKFKAKVQNEYS